MGSSLSNDPECDINGCPYYADYAVYPDRFKRIELAVYVCEPHHTDAEAKQEPRQELYGVVNSMIRESLG